MLWRRYCTLVCLSAISELANHLPNSIAKTRESVMLKSFSHIKTRKFLIHFFLLFFLLGCIQAILKSTDNISPGETPPWGIWIFIFFIIWMLFNLRRPSKTLSELLGINITFSKLEIVAISVGKFLLTFGFTILILRPLFGFEIGSLYVMRYKLSMEHFSLEPIHFIKLIILSPNSRGIIL